MPRRIFPLLAGGLIGCAVALLASTPPLRAEEVLYRLETTCSLSGGEPQDCTVEAVDDGTATLYRHRIGSRTETIRISDTPIRMARLIESGDQWSPLTSAGARFSTNTICFNGRDLCVINPNYLNSVMEESPAALADRDLVRVHFGSDGRVDITCYDDGCEAIKP
jgi:hypothetical protein